jgi:hypothetical protein
MAFGTKRSVTNYMATAYSLIVMQSMTTRFQHDVSKDMPATIVNVGPPNQATIAQ